jgi:hypothetical protein
VNAIPSAWWSKKWRGTVNTKPSTVDFLRAAQQSFGQATDAAEFLHGVPEDNNHSVSETYWYEILIPEQNIVGHVYIWTRSNLRVCHAGVWFTQGFAEHPLLMDHYDFRMALPMPTVDGNIVSVPDLGLAIEVLEPQKSTRITYKPTDTSVSLELTTQAVTPLVMRDNGKHFQQFVRSTGRLLLNDKAFAVNHIGARDRSWATQRPEMPTKFPLTSWISGTLDDGRIAFNAVGTDDPNFAEWRNDYDIPKEQLFFDGWILRDARLRKIVRMSKRTERDASNRMRAISIVADLEEADGTIHTVRGRPIAGSWVLAWPNLYTWLGMTEWHLDEHKGYGDTQEYCWTDYCKRHWKRMV